MKASGLTRTSMTGNPGLLRSRLFRSLYAMVIVLAFGTSLAKADFTCGGTLRDSQRAGFERMFLPPYSLSLVSMGANNMSKRLTAARLNTLQASKPVPVVTYTLTDTHANLLRNWLNENATDSVPGWVSTAIGIAAPFLGLAADGISQVVNYSGDAGRLRVANLAGTVTKGGRVGVIEQIGKDRNGQLKFIASYIYTAQINNQYVTTLLAICSADVVVDSPVTKYPDCPTGGSEYCYCAYEKDLDELKQSVNDREITKQRLTAAKNTLNQCISRAGN